MRVSDATVWDAAAQVACQAFPAVNLTESLQRPLLPSVVKAKYGGPRPDPADETANQDCMHLSDASTKGESGDQFILKGAQGAAVAAVQKTPDQRAQRYESALCDENVPPPDETVCGSAAAEAANLHDSGAFPAVDNPLARGGQGLAIPEPPAQPGVDVFTDIFAPPCPVRGRPTMFPARQRTELDFVVALLRLPALEFEGFVPLLPASRSSRGASCTPDLAQDFKDVKRDKLRLNRRYLNTSQTYIEFYETVAKVVQCFGAPEGDGDGGAGSSDSFERACVQALVLLHLVNRTFAGGNCFERVLQCFGNERLTLILPRGAAARPLSIAVRAEPLGSLGSATTAPRVAPASAAPVLSAPTVPLSPSRAGASPTEGKRASPLMSPKKTPREQLRSPAVSCAGGPMAAEATGDPATGAPATAVPAPPARKAASPQFEATPGAPLPAATAVLQSHTQFDVVARSSSDLSPVDAGNVYATVDAFFVARIPLRRLAGRRLLRVAGAIRLQAAEAAKSGLVSDRLARWLAALPEAGDQSAPRSPAPVVTRPRAPKKDLNAESPALAPGRKSVAAGAPAAADGFRYKIVLRTRTEPASKQRG